MLRYILPLGNGAHLYALNSGNSSTASMLRKTCKLAVAVAKKIRTFQFVAKNPGMVPGMGSGGTFAQLNDLSCPEVVQSMTVMSVSSDGGSGTICAALKSGSFILVNLDTAVIRAIPLPTGAFGGVMPVSCLGVVDPTDDSEVDFLVSYNQVSLFKSNTGETSRQYDIRWSSRPHGVAYV